MNRSIVTDRLARAVWAFCVALVIHSPSARADDPRPDAGTNPSDTTPAPNTAPPPDGTPAPAITEPAPLPENADADNDRDDKDKHKHDDSTSDDMQGDLVHADDVGGLHGAFVSFRFLLQTRYTQTFVKEPLDPLTVLDPRLDDGYSISRAFMRVTADPYPWLSTKVLADFAELQHKNPKRALKLAYAELRASKRLSVTVGLFKRTFSLLELLPVADYELATAGPTDDLIKNAELGGRDTGALVNWRPLRKKKHLVMSAGVFSGKLDGVDARPYGLMTARIMSETKHWRFGIDGALRPRGETSIAGVPEDPAKGHAVSADVSFHHKHYELRTEWLWGTRSDGPNAGTAKTWMAAWSVASFNVAVSDDVVLIPAARFEWLDADLEHDIGRRFYVSGAFNVSNIADNIRALVEVTRSQVQRGSYPINSAPVLLDRSSTAVVVQVQVKI